tara:strand:- start:14 stop:580 length:567 start_codon:yes stop_codon:yes gene_type:complete
MMTQEQKDKKKKHIAKYKKEYYLKNEENIKKYRKEYSLKNKEKIAKYCKEYNLKNKESKIKYNKKYRLNNKEHLSKVKLNYQREQYKNNPNFKLKRNLRGRVWSALKGISKSAPTMELLGCSVDKLWNHLESKFESWMTKENYGLWHVDHIIACAKFDLTCPKQQRTCFHYTNLQPLEAIENMRKGAR